MELHLTPGHMTLADLRRVYQQPARVTLDPAAAGPIEASVACVERIIVEGRTAYGINTGFGLLATTRIAREDLEALQSSLVLSHAAGVGEALDDAKNLPGWYPQSLGIAPQTVSHEEFKRRTAKARAMVRTGECTPYANIILIAGVKF